MNPVGEEGNVFSNLFDKVPAKRAGNEDDIAGTILYLVSRAGVSPSSLVRGFMLRCENIANAVSRRTWMEHHFVLMEAVFCLPMVKNNEIKRT